ncbi:MAG: hypothetical protein AAGE94_00395 [Acidobacteriota bacterium]
MQAAHAPHAPASAPPKRGRFARFVAIALLFLCMPIFVFGATVAATGTVTVSVHEKADGMNLWIPVPALLFDAAVFAAPMIIPDDALADVRREIEPYRETLETLADDIESIPAGSVLVEVQDGRDHVLITKTWRNFEISVQSDDADIQVSVPARLLSRSLDLF